MMTVWLCISVAVLAFLFGVGGLYLQKLLPEPGFLPADVIVAGGLDVFNGETCTPRGPACEE